MAPRKIILISESRGIRMNVRIVLQLHFLTLKKHKIKIKARETTCVSLSYWSTLNKIWPKLNALTQTVHAGPLMFTEEKSYKSRCNMCNAQLLQTWPYLCPTSCCSNNLLWPSRQHHFVVLAPINVHSSLNTKHGHVLSIRVLCMSWPAFRCISMTREAKNHK